jgi:amyloid beta precursor protein binding protein 1
MKAQSKVYIQLQGIYKAKARKDAAEILQIVQAAPGGEHVDPAEVDLFCKNAAFVKLINATGGGASGSDGKISRADRLKSAAGKHSDPLHPPLPRHGLEPLWATPHLSVSSTRR